MAIKIAGTEVINDDKELVLAKLAEVNASIADTAVDVFVYDTSKDSDGGAWRKRTQHTSWYNETLNTATRGSRKEFPAVAVIVAETNQITIYDGDDPSLPMWMVFDGANSNDMVTGGAGQTSSVFALNGSVCVGSNVAATSSAGGVKQIMFIRDTASQRSSKSTGGGIGYYRGNIEQRNDALYYGTELYDQYGDAAKILDLVVNDVAMTVLPNAPIDSATGLPIPTIAVATSGGVSVIKDDGTVVDSGSTIAEWVMFDEDTLYFEYSNSAKYQLISTLADGFTGYDFAESLVTTPIYAHGSVSAGKNAVIRKNVIAVGSEASSGSGLGIYEKTQDTTNYGSLANLGLDSGYKQAIITSSYNTGWMNGDIKLATLSDTDDTDVTGSEFFSSGDFTGWTSGDTNVLGVNPDGTVSVNDGNHVNNTYLDSPVLSTEIGKTYVITITTENTSSTGLGLYTRTTSGPNGYVWDRTFTFTANRTDEQVRLFRYRDHNGTATITSISMKLAEEDRSVNGNPLQVFGTVTKNPVATGADLVAYSGFSVSTYLEQPYNSDLSYGTDDFYVTCWYKGTDNYGTYIDTRKRSDGTKASGRWSFAQTAVGSSSALQLGLDANVLTSIETPEIVSDSWVQVFVVRTSTKVDFYINGKLSNSINRSLDNLSSVETPLTTIGQRYDGAQTLSGSLALLRTGKGAPSAEQIKKIYEDEKVLFQEGAQATLYGSSDAVTALAYDDSTELLHVGTSAGRSVFSGLRRVDNTTDGVGAAISASNGMVVEE